MLLVILTKVKETSVFYIKSILEFGKVVQNRTLELDCLGSNSSFTIIQLGDLGQGL